jgi:hypothetical protein
MKNKKYIIEFTEEQLAVIARGLEFYSRFLAGQWGIPDEMEWQEYKNQDKYEGFWEKRNHVEDQLNVLKSQFTGLPLNASYGIGSSKQHENTKTAYDIYRPIWEEFNKDSKLNNVYSSPGLSYSKEGRIKIEIKDETT